MDTIDQILHEYVIPENGVTKPSRVLTVRIPAPLHEALRKEALDRNTSMNRLAVAKLMIKAETIDAALQLAVAEEPPTAVNPA